MVHKQYSQREKPTVRGRPFVKGNKRGKLEYHVLDAQGHRSGDSGGVIDPHSLNGHLDTSKHEIEVLQTPKEETMKPEDPNLVESLEFVNGENVISLKFLKVSSRNYKIKVLLNNEIELKPTSFITKVSANDSWDMLKRMLKK